MGVPGKPPRVSTGSAALGKGGVSGKASAAHGGYGATAARLTPDQKVGSSNLSALSSASSCGGGGVGWGLKMEN